MNKIGGVCVTGKIIRVDEQLVALIQTPRLEIFECWRNTMYFSIYGSCVSSKTKIDEIYININAVFRIL